MLEKTTKKLKIMALYSSNYLAQFHVREIAKILGKNHVTLLPHLASLEKDNILTSRTVGKNKVYTLKFENIITKNYITSAELAATTAFLEEVFLVKKITEEMFRLHLPGAIILFGSYAKRAFKENSDIDVLYIGRITEQEIQRVQNIGKVYGKKISIKKTTIQNFELGLRKKDPLLVEVVKNHILLQHPEVFVNALWRMYEERR
jgi:predicted nucleotidyltransferase